MMYLAAAGWALAIVVIYVAFDQQRIIRNAWNREDWYRSQLLKACELLSKPPIIFPDGSIK